jgi:hypothetical protein
MEGIPVLGKIVGCRVGLFMIFSRKFFRSQIKVCQCGGFVGGGGRRWGCRLYLGVGILLFGMWSCLIIS